MSQNQTFNGVVYPIPTRGDVNWAAPLDRYLVALGTYALAPSSGLFTLTANVNFGASFGLLSAYFSSRGTAASSGLLRLANLDTVAWRNFANSGNNVLAVDSSNNLTYNGVVIPASLSTLTDGQIWIGNASNAPTGRTLSGDVTVTNAGVTSIGANKLVNNQVNSAAAIAYSKLNLNSSIVNADVANAAAIALSKLAALTASKAVVTDGSGLLSAATTTATEIGYVNGVTSAIQTQLDAKQATGNYITALTGDITASGPGSVASTLATVNSNVGSFTHASLTVNAKGLITAASSGTVTSGTVTSVAMTVPTFLSIGGSPVTTSGTLAVTLSGTALPVINGGTGVTTSTGSGNNVLSTSPTLVTPILGVAAATSINFGGTALSTYAEGTWTPADNSGAALTFTGVTATYTRIGRVVYIQCFLTFPVTASGAGVNISGLPFTVATNGYGTAAVETNAATANIIASFRSGATNLLLVTTADAAVTNVNMTAKYMIFTGFYFV